jgi:hypothetical protein
MCIYTHGVDPVNCCFVRDRSSCLVAGKALSEGEGFVASGQAWEISYQGGTGKDVVIYAVPEPAMAFALMAGITLLGLRRPRRM